MLFRSLPSPLPSARPPLTCASLLPPSSSWACCPPSRLLVPPPPAPPAAGDGPARSPPPARVKLHAASVMACRLLADIFSGAVQAGRRLLPDWRSQPPTRPSRLVLLDAGARPMGGPITRSTAPRTLSRCTMRRRRFGHTRSPLHPLPRSAQGGRRSLQ